MKSFVSDRICVDLTECREFSFKDTLKGSNDTQSESLENELKLGYSEFIENFINHGETYGYKNRYFTKQKINPDSESDNESYLSSFIEIESESSLGPSQDLENAINEGFYVVGIEEFTKKPLKRRRNSGDNEEIAKILSKLPRCSNENKQKKIPGSLITLIKEVSLLLKNSKTIEAIKVYQQIANQTGIGFDRVMKCVKIEEICEMKKEAYENFIKNYNLCKTNINEFKNLKWGIEIDKILMETDLLLEKFVDVNNQLACLTDKKEDIILLDEVRMKYLNQFFIIKDKRIGSCVVVINIESQDLEELPKIGKVFEECFEFELNDFEVN